MRGSDKPRLPASRWPSLLCLPLGLLATGLVYGAARLPGWLDDYLAVRSKLRALCVEANIINMADAVAWLGVLVAALCLAAATLGFVRRPWALRLIRAACCGGWLLGGVYLYVVHVGTGLPLKYNLQVDCITPTACTQFFWRLGFCWPVFLIAVLLALLYLCTWRRAALAVYFRRNDLPSQPGDRFLENLRTHGQEPRLRKWLYGSVMLHLSVIVVIPGLLYHGVGGCIPPYRVPKGEGVSVVQVTRVVRVKQKKKRPKRVAYWPHNTISIGWVPEIEDRQVAEQVEMESRETYMADPQRIGRGFRSSSVGFIGKAKQGWPYGMEDHCVRLIRMEYNGHGWDDGMDSAARADLNFLDKFKELTGFKVADKVESYPIRYLRSCKKGFAPPFVFITGDRSFTIPASDTKILRAYLLGGGMLLADCASAEWGRAFRQYVQAQLLPGHGILNIADDDPLFQQPYSFPNGAPPLWHHAGTRVWGVKHNGRWLVYCHPGDLHDAWKTGHSGMDPRLAEDGFLAGINVIFYAFTQYLEQTRNERK